MSKPSRSYVAVTADELCLSAALPDRKEEKTRFFQMFRSSVRLLKVDEVVKSRSHTKLTEITKKNLDIFNMTFFVPLCLRVKNALLTRPSKLQNFACRIL